MFHRKLRQMHADSSREMISIEDRYFSLNRVLLLIVGLWPYQKSKLARLQFICFFSILITFIIFQLTTFITLKCTANFIIKVLSLAFGFICITIKYYSFFINSETVRDLMEQFQRIYNNLEDINEIAIIEKYGRNARYYTATLTILFVCSIFVPMSALIWPDILQIISSTNTSRPRQLQVSSEYFVDQEKYFYYLLLHINAAACIGLTSAVATGTMLIAYLQYICGMFTIASYRVQNAIKIQISQDIIVRNKKLAHSRIKSAVDIHRKAMEVMTLSLNMFRIFQIGSSTRNVEELSISIIVGFISLLYMFVANLVGQEITDHYNYIYIAAYKIRWYIAPPDIQKLLLILIQRGNKTFGLNIGGLFIASIQCFAKLANASLSYFTVMYSVRQ
ncbi:odorant receptor 30a-like isoform X1 [Polyergus mexicanus]|uniref:odorant receptor 30a-like isoform X1 n=1 Tax=Polyergus mexicanus TaxID=615972 RepID=UPI0038B64315